MAQQATQQERGQFDGILRRSFDVTTRAVNRETRSVEVVASTDTVDAHGDVVEQDWNLKRYEKNPVVLWQHNQFDSSRYSMGGAVEPEDLLPIGHAENVRVEGGKLIAKIIFGSKDYNEMSERVFLGFVEGHIRAVSVGFRAGEVTKELLPNGSEVFHLANCELMEISAVTIPANPDAVAKSIAAEREFLGRMAATKTATSEEPTMAMSAEEQKQLTDARDAAKAANDRAERLESELKSEKAAASKLEAELKAASERAKTAEAAIVESTIKALVGKKIAPAEVEEQVQLAKDIGLERVTKMLANRADMTLTQPVAVVGADGNKKAITPTTPEPLDTASNDASGDIAKAALSASRAA